MKNGSVHRYKAAVVALVSVAVLLTLGAAVRYWLPPWVPLAVFCLLGAAPLLFWSTLGALVFDPSKATDGIVQKDSPPLLERFRMALGPVVLGVLIGAGLTGLWLVPAVRLAATHASASQRLVETLGAAFADESADVRLAACEGLAEIGDDTSFSIVVGLADRTPEVVDCALNVLPASENPPRALGGAGAKWYRELMTLEDVPAAGETACRLADRLRTAERKGLRQAPMYLMQCALDAPSAPSRECCGQAFRAVLGGNDVEPSMVMAPPRELIMSGFAESVPSLLRTAYAQDPKGEQRRSELRLGTPRTAAWALSIGCGALDFGVQWREPVSAAMAEVVSSEQCALQPATETTVRVWTAVCSEVFSEERLEVVERDQGGVFCQALSGALTADAASSARHEIQRSIRVAREPGRRSEVLRALLDYSASRGVAAASSTAASGKSSTKLVSPFSAMLAPSDSSSNGDGQMQLMMRLMGGSPDVIMRDGETTAEYLTRYRTSQDQGGKAKKRPGPSVVHIR